MLFHTVSRWGLILLRHSVHVVLELRLIVQVFPSFFYTEVVRLSSFIHLEKFNIKYRKANQKLNLEK